MLVPLLLTLPWLAVVAFVVFRVTPPRVLPPASVPRADAPLVSVVIPARNEAVNIGTCLDSVTASRYPRFEVVVVDDRSDDETGELARRCPRRNARRLDVIRGEALPSGWVGKPWACAQGARQASGELLLFTDADTRHGPGLLGRAVAELQVREADVVSVTGRQLMETFWERLVQPQIFLNMMFRFWNVDRWVERGRWRDAIANGQFLLFRRSSYDALGGHAAVRGEVVEDLRLAQEVVRGGRRLVLRVAEDELAVRMYRSLPEIVRGWSKNVLLGALQTMPRWTHAFVAPLALSVGATLWLAPPVVLAAAAFGLGPPPLLVWSTVATAVSVLFWMGFTQRFGAPARYGLLYPAGAAVSVYILLRAWWRSSNVEWKGREYRVDVYGRGPGA